MFLKQTLKYQVEASQLTCNNYTKKDSQKINQKATKQLPKFRLDAIALLRVIMTNIKKKKTVKCIGYIGDNCHMGVTKLGVALN